MGLTKIKQVVRWTICIKQKTPQLMPGCFLFCYLFNASEDGLLVQHLDE